MNLRKPMKQVYKVNNLLSYTINHRIGKTEKESILLDPRKSGSKNKEQTSS